MSPVAHSALRARTERRRVDGILLLDKPAGPSSNQVLQTARRLLSAEKAGHTGTLDPFATGLLPLMFGEATKFSSFLLDSYKVYEATLLLGVTTSTGDITGEVTERRAASVERGEVEGCAAAFVGPGTQVPPMHSALKRDGVPLYMLARRGEVIEREPRRIEITELTVTDVRSDRIDIRVKCSKGTYIRVLAEDLGRALGCGATLEHLRRVEVGAFRIDDAVSLDLLSQQRLQEADKLLLPVDAGLQHLPVVSVASVDGARLQLGQRIRQVQAELGRVPFARAYVIESMEFIGLVSLTGAEVQPVRLVVPPTAKMA